MLPAAVVAVVAIIAAGTFAAWLLAAGTGFVAAVAAVVAAVVHTEIVAGPVAADTPHWTGAADIAFDFAADEIADH